MEANLNWAELNDAYRDSPRMWNNPDALAMLLRAQEYMDKTLGDHEENLTAEFERGSAEGRADCVNENITGDDGIYRPVRLLIAMLEDLPEHEDNVALALCEEWVKTMDRYKVVNLETIKKVDAEVDELKAKLKPKTVEDLL